ncbi:hypothetical protein CC2G_001800 [Coprinopsis cinerea AmutBmut pab1-1]|nr:hypothetical protein CC2G_001800 [Coprinopsis cinerea AmutBmut pab1-1]
MDYSTNPTTPPKFNIIPHAPPVRPAPPSSPSPSSSSPGVSLALDSAEGLDIAVVEGASVGMSVKLRGGELSSAQ